MAKNTLKICVALGTRPEIIKLAPVIKELTKRKIDYFVIHTGQHYSPEMDEMIFKDLELNPPKYNLKVGSSAHNIQTADILMKTGDILEKENVNLVLVQGDTNSVLAVALTAVKMHIKVGHIEAGLRSYDRRMPEEINRVIVDHISDYLYVPTILGKKILIDEGIKSDNILNVGNTVVDAVIQNSILAKKNSTIINTLKLENTDYCLITLHRQENVDDSVRMSKILNSLTDLINKSDLTFVWLMHPRTNKKLHEFNLANKLNNISNLILLTPVGYLDMLKLESEAQIIITDSGGIQEEACILKIPCVTLRESTERPESIIIKANILTKPNSKELIKKFELMRKSKRNWKNPFGNGDSAEKIVKHLLTLKT